MVSNHTDFAELVGSYDIPFHHIPVTKDTKPEAEARVLEIVREENVELVVLARYMQVLSDGPVQGAQRADHQHHHSFLR
ncbi:Formyltetrahydrofolate deformylase OS=Streptomyces tendae OX=1932 GN=purU PE=3 SV=1 [Streptomyces tendae]